MAWNWTKLDEKPNGDGIVVQFHEYGCAAACGAMLLRDRGFEVDQLTFAAALPMPTTGRRLAERLNRLSAGKHAWKGGSLATADGTAPGPLALRQLSRFGTWSAQLIPLGTTNGHWVVIDDITDQLVAVRDPAGSSYHLPIIEFLDLMRFTVVTFEHGGSA